MNYIYYMSEKPKPYYVYDMSSGIDSDGLKDVHIENIGTNSGVYVVGSGGKFYRYNMSSWTDMNEDIDSTAEDLKKVTGVNNYLLVSGTNTYEFNDISDPYERKLNSVGFVHIDRHSNNTVFGIAGASNTVYYKTKTQNRLYNANGELPSISPPIVITDSSVSINADDGDTIRVGDTYYDTDIKYTPSGGSYYFSSSGIMRYTKTNKHTFLEFSKYITGKYSQGDYTFYIKQSDQNKLYVTDWFQTSPIVPDNPPTSTTTLLINHTNKITGKSKTGRTGFMVVGHDSLCKFTKDGGSTWIDIDLGGSYDIEAVYNEWSVGVATYWVVGDGLCKKIVITP